MTGHLARGFLGFALLVLFTGAACAVPDHAPSSPLPASNTPPVAAADVLVVGAGMAGLSAALEAAEHGARVEVIDMASVFGGHAVMSGADVTMVDTPLQRAQGIRDSPDLAFEDFIRWGGDNNRQWVRYYVEHSRTEIYDWLTALGVRFRGLRPYAGNRVPRAHMTEGLGLGLVGPVYRACLNNPRISFHWNTQVTGLILTAGRVTGARTVNTRSGEAAVHSARAVILATGGFQSNLARVRQNWPPDSPVPQRLLAGSGINSMGSGLDLASEIGARLSNLDHQWNYQRGLPDPRYPGAERGLNAGVGNAIWVNSQGRRFVNEGGSSPETLRAVLHQQPATYWAVFDDRSREAVWVVGTGWDRDSVKRWILNNPQLLKRADSITELAGKMGVPAQALQASIARYNALVGKGEDEDFGRFGKAVGSSDSSSRVTGAVTAPPPIDKPPFYALQFFPLTRKSMGGVAIDLLARVLDKADRPIQGLYAAGEAAGLAGINGRAALEGTFLGPSVLTGRIAGRAAVADLQAGVAGADRSPPATIAHAADGRLPAIAVSSAKGSDSAAAVGAPNRANAVAAGSEKAAAGSENAAAASERMATDCLGCHDLKVLVVARRPGYWHFERAHTLVLERNLPCQSCHSGMPAPGGALPHQIDRLAQSASCAVCHHSPQ